MNAASTIKIRDMYIEAVSSGRGVAANGGASALISNVWINAAGPHIYHNASGTLQVENCLLNGAGSGYVGVS